MLQNEVARVLGLPTERAVQDAGADAAFRERYRLLVASLRPSADGQAVALDYELAGGCDGLNDQACLSAQLGAALISPENLQCGRLVQRAIGVDGYRGDPGSLAALLLAQTVHEEDAEVHPRHDTFALP